MTGEQQLAGGVVHLLPEDLQQALLAEPAITAAWQDITPLARNEWICWVEDAKQAATRAKRIGRAQEELAAGKRRPCRWPGCAHREKTGKA
ncbi:YdeI/OmpD-associated family protein [Micrococcoides hystricis]|uniref:YdeI/OmpD-associated family protein n=1 Tax=Micrococcoides hystricis TaxID=1572761 RepID=A0ABV6PB88_9MICC